MANDRVNRPAIGKGVRIDSQNTFRELYRLKH